MSKHYGKIAMSKTLTASSMPLSAARRRGFTMAELLIAMALGLIILGVVTYTFHRCSRGQARALAVMDLHQRANVLMRILETDLSSLHPCGGMYFSGPNANPQTITFLTCQGKLNYDGDVSTSIFPGVPGQETPLDIAWVRYYWTNDEPNPLKRKLYRRLDAYINEGHPPKKPSSSGSEGENAITVGDVTACEIMRGVSLFQLSLKNDSNVKYNAATQVTGLPVSSNSDIRPARADITFRLVHGTEGSTMGITFTKTVVLPGGKR